MTIVEAVQSKHTGWKASACDAVAYLLVHDLRPWSNLFRTCGHGDAFLYPDLIHGWEVCSLLIFQKLRVPAFLCDVLDRCF